MHLAIHHYYNGQAHGNFRSCHHHVEEYHYLCGGVVVHFGKCDQQQVHGVEHHLDAHEYNNGVTTYERTHDAYAKQGKT